MEENQPKISTVEIIFIGLIFVFCDIIGILLIFFALDDFFIIDLITSAIFFYLYMKNVPSMRMLINWLIELIPWIGALPLLTFGWILTCWADRHPEGALAKAGALAESAKGKGKEGVVKAGS